ncbi:MAG TPA: hypothetical protein VGO69_12685 [Pyrinomonadaceae bacterium]|jgi:hypothetical protein|nr:hypothetical protein [Pyrinomonadaceae bacterium]
MQHRLIQSVGIAWTILYSVFIIWIYATEPRSFKEVTAIAKAAAGINLFNQEKFDTALMLFRQDKFRAARDEWERADPAKKHPRTQFYIAYAFYREGWGRISIDKELFKQGLEAVNRVIVLTSEESFTVDDDPDLQMHTPAELKTELEQGTEKSFGYFFGTRK